MSAPEPPTDGGALATDVEAQIESWRSFVAARQAVDAGDVDELEDHLRDEIGGLEASGLAPDEAFIVAVKRLGRLSDLSREFAREHSERLWKQLMLGDRPGADAAKTPRDRRLAAAIVIGVCAAIVLKVPSFLGAGGFGDPPVVGGQRIGVLDPAFYTRNTIVLVLPFLAAFLVFTRRPPLRNILVVAAGVVVTAVVVNAYPFALGDDTYFLAIVHSGVALWLLIGLIYTGADWRGDRARMDWVRFTGEWFVYAVLLALGGGALCGLTIGVFGALGLNAAPIVLEWVLPFGGAGIVVIAAWLVEAKQGVIENIAPVLTKVFTPLFTVLLIALVVAAVIQRDLIDARRDLLVIFTVVLLVVLGLLLYSMSARDPLQRPGWFDRLQLVMVSSALVVDAILLVAMLARIGAFGASPNKVASLGLNLILFVNLAGAAWLLVRFLRGRRPFAALERWQTSYLPIYLAWTAVVAVVFPPVFAFT